MQPGESLRELSYTANFVYTTVPKVYTALLSKPESFFKFFAFSTS